MLERLHGVVAAGAEVGAVAHGDEAGAGLRRPPDGLFHRPVADDEAQALVAVDDRRRRSVADDLDIGLGVGPPFPQPPQIRGPQAGDAVRIDPAQVGDDDDVGGDAGVFFAEARFAEGSEDEFGELAGLTITLAGAIPSLPFPLSFRT